MNTDSLWLMVTWLEPERWYEFKTLTGFLVAFVFLKMMNSKYLEVLYQNLLCTFGFFKQEYLYCLWYKKVIESIYWHLLLRMNKLFISVRNEWHWHSNIINVIFIGNIWLVSEKRIWPYQIIKPSSFDISQKVLGDNSLAWAA